MVYFTSMKTKIIFSVIFVILVSAAIILLYKTRSGRPEIKNGRASLASRKREWGKLEKAIGKKVTGFKGTVGIVIKDLDTGREIAFNKNTLMPSASLVKIPIMLSCFYAAQDGKIGLKDIVSLKSSERVAGSKVLGNMPSGSRFTVEELFDPMITQSDNAAANALIDVLGFDTLNGYFKKMGLRNTNIARHMMDFKEREEGEENYTSTADMAYLLEKLYRKQFLNREVSDRCLSLLGGQKINDRIPRKLPRDGVFVAHKTGLERHVCHDVGIVYTQTGNFLICVLVKHDSKLARPAKKFISNIALLTYNYYRGLSK